MVWKFGFNELFPFYTQDSVHVCSQDECAVHALFSAQEEEAFFCTYIYISHITHIIWTTWLNGLVKWIRVNL